RDLALFEIRRKLLRRRRRNSARLAAIERHVLDAAFLVAIVVDRLGRGLRRSQSGADRLCDLAAQCGLALLELKSLLAVADLADALEIRRQVELAVEAAEGWIRPDLLFDLGVRNVGPKLARALIERRGCDHLAERSLLEAEGARLLRRDRPAQLATELLQLLVVARAELLNRNLRAADLGNGRDPETAENIADAPDPEADDQEP